MQLATTTQANTASEMPEMAPKAKVESKTTKVIFVDAYFQPIGKTVMVKVPTGETTKGLFGEKQVFREEEQFQRTGWSDRLIDGARLARDLGEAIKTLDQEGYDIVSVEAVTSGNYNYSSSWNGAAGAGLAYGYGWSFTEGMIVVARRSRVEDDVSLKGER